MRTRIVVILALVAATTACGHQAGSARSPDSSGSSEAVSTPSTGTSTTTPPVNLTGARRVVQAYVEAWDHHSPAGICALESSATRTAETGAYSHIFHQSVTCSQVESLQFHSMQDNPPELFRSVSVVHWLRTEADGRFAVVRASIHVMFPSGPPVDDPQTADFYLTRDHGAWRMLQDGDMSDIVRGDPANIDASFTPLVPSDLTTPVPLAAPGFECAGQKAVYDDSRDDVRDALTSSESSPGRTVQAPWLDIRSVTLYGIDGPHPCVDVTFAQPIRAGTTIDFMTDNQQSAVLEVGARPEFEYGGLARTPHPFGETGATIRVLLDPNMAIDGWGNLSVCVTQRLLRQPLLKNFSLPQDVWSRDPAQATAIATCP